MIIEYTNSKLKKLAENPSSLSKKYGNDQSIKMLKAINMLKSIERLSHIPLGQSFRPHPLTNSSSDKLFSIDIKHPYRMLFIPIGEYDENDWEDTITLVKIVELYIDTHDSKFKASNY